MEFEASQSIFDDVEKLIKKGFYKNWQEFMETSIRNQLTLESGHDKNGYLPTDHPAHPDFPMFRELGLNWDKESIKPLPPIETRLLKSEHMPFCNRILPAKVASRVLCNVLDHRSSLELNTFNETLWTIVQELGHYLSYLDKMKGHSFRLEALSTAFPRMQRHGDPSAKQRFLNHFVGFIDSGGKANGMILTLGFATITEAGDIGITKSGHNFAMLKSPILDEWITMEGNLELTLSKEEVQMYLQVVNERLPAEAKSMEMIRSVLADGGKSYPKICERFEGKLLKEENVRALVSLLLGRMRELMLIDVKQDGLKTYYELK
jgi:hypothetical protein